MCPLTRSSSVSARSSSRKCASPFSPKISTMVFPSRRSISLSKSRKLRDSRSATARPMVDFPAPGSPTSTRCGRCESATDTGFEIREIAVIIAPHLREGVAAELLEECFGEDQRCHPLGDHAHGGNSSDVAAFSDRGGWLTRVDIDGRQGPHQGGDRLHPYMKDERLPGGDTTLQAAGAIGAPAHISGERSLRLRLDLVVNFGPRAFCHVEAEADRDGLHRWYGHH